MDKELRKYVAQALKTKSVLKQDVFANTTRWFGILKDVLSEVHHELCDDMDGCDTRVVVKYTDKGPHEADFQIAGDTLIFHMHTNVFTFDSRNPIWKSSYLEDPRNGHCGIINVYNFLTDSFRYHRDNDAGYLIARIFINHEDHFIVQGRRQFAVRYNNFGTSILTKDLLKDVVYDAFSFTMNFDMYIPPYDAVKEVSVFEIRELSDHLRIKTGKRLGFQFSANKEDDSMFPHS